MSVVSRLSFVRTSLPKLPRTFVPCAPEKRDLDTLDLVFIGACRCVDLLNEAIGIWTIRHVLTSFSFLF